MKIRTDFVTNSSSSSFIININKCQDSENYWKLEDVEEVLGIILDSYNEIYNQNLKFEDVYGFLGSKDSDGFKSALENAFYGEDDELLREYMGADFVLFSACDNTIPYQIFSFICSILRAERRHLG